MPDQLLFKLTAMRLLFLSIITLGACTLQAQQAKPSNKILIGFNFSPDYSFRTLKNENGSPSTDLVIKNRNNIEISKFGYTTGLNLNFNCSDRLAFQTGLQYSNKGYQTKTGDLVYETPDPQAPNRAKFTYVYQYIGIPLTMKFSIGKGKARFVTGIGIMNNFLVNAKQIIALQYASGKSENKSQSTTSRYQRMDISPMIHVGIDYQVNDRTHLLAEPTFRYGILKTMDAVVGEHLWSGGVNVGVFRSLK